MAPRLLLTNWSSRSVVGPRYNIMLRPRRWEHGQGTVRLLTPFTCAEAFDAALISRSDEAMLAYRRAFEAQLEVHLAKLAPGVLTARRGTEDPVVLEPGSVLCCACSVASADAERCHRTWALPFLRRAGWDASLAPAQLALTG